MKVAVLFANGTEEIESLTVVDVVRRTGAKCDILGTDKRLIGSHNIVVEADCLLSQTDLSLYDAIVIPGGMPGATNIASDKKTVEQILKAYNNGKLIASICASPAVVLADNDIIAGKNATCYPAPSFIQSIKQNNVYIQKNVVIDQNLITADGPKSAMEFSLAICSYLNLTIKF